MVFPAEVFIASKRMMKMKFSKLSCRVEYPNIDMPQSPLKSLLNRSVLEHIVTRLIHGETGKVKLHQGHKVGSTGQRLGLILDHLTAEMTLLSDHC